MHLCSFWQILTTFCSSFWVMRVTELECCSSNERPPSPSGVVWLWNFKHKITLGQMLLKCWNFFNSNQEHNSRIKIILITELCSIPPKKWNCAQFPGIELKGFWFPLGTEHNSRWNCGWELSSRDGIVVGNWAQGKIYGTSQLVYLWQSQRFIVKREEITWSQGTGIVLNSPVETKL